MADIGSAFLSVANAFQRTGVNQFSVQNDAREGLAAARERAAAFRKEQQQLTETRRAEQTNQTPANGESTAITGTGPTGLLSIANVGLLQNAAPIAVERANENAATLPSQAQTSAVRGVPNDAVPPGDQDAENQVTGGEEDEDGPGAANLTPEERQQVQQLSQRDAEVRRHEAAHAAAGGQFAGSPQLQFESGPDGRQYAVSGEVSINAGPEGTPEATIAKSQVVRAAALAPAEPSAQDLRVAAEATRQAASARAELREQEVEESREDGDGSSGISGSGSSSSTGAVSSEAIGPVADAAADNEVGNGEAGDNPVNTQSGDAFADQNSVDNREEDRSIAQFEERASIAVQADRAFSQIQAIQTRIAEGLSGGSITRSYA